MEILNAKTQPFAILIGEVQDLFIISTYKRCSPLEISMVSFSLYFDVTKPRPPLGVKASTPESIIWNSVGSVLIFLGAYSIKTFLFKWKSFFEVLLSFLRIILSAIFLDEMCNLFESKGRRWIAKKSLYFLSPVNRNNYFFKWLFQPDYHNFHSKRCDECHMQFKNHRQKKNFIFHREQQIGGSANQQLQLNFLRRG